MSFAAPPTASAAETYLPVRVGTYTPDTPTQPMLAVLVATTVQRYITLALHPDVAALFHTFWTCDPLPPTWDAELAALPGQPTTLFWRYVRFFRLPLTALVIAGLVNDTFVASVLVQGRHIPIRPSVGLLIALRQQIPIDVNEAVMMAGGYPWPPPGIADDL